MPVVGDGHRHWHVQKLQTTVLLRVVNGETEVAAGAKPGFCFYDTVRYRKLPGGPSSPCYTGCGSSSSSLSVKMGLSVGWGDEYPWDIAYQYVDITGLPSGTYRLVVTADASNWFLESNDSNNATWVDLEISPSAVRILGYGPA